MTLQEDITFYPFQNDVIEHAAPQTTLITAKGYEVIMKKIPSFSRPLDEPLMVSRSILKGG